MKKFKRFLAKMLICCLIVLGQTAFALDYGAWYTKYVNYATELELLECNNPNENISNAEFISALLKIMENEPPESNAVIDYAKEQGYVLSDEMTDGAASITRQSVAKVISRALQLTGVSDVSISEKISDWDMTCPKCKDAIVKCYANGIMSGYEDGTFRGRYPVTRAEAAVILIKVYDYAGVLADE